MTLNILTSTGFVAVLLLSACKIGDQTPLENLNHGNPPVFQTDSGPPAGRVIHEASFYNSVDEAHPKIEGASVRLVRDPDLQTAVAEEWNVKGLTPGDVVTVWWVFFTNQDDCVAGILDLEPEVFEEINVLCGPDDLSGDFVDAIIPGFGYAGPAPMGGAVVDANGEATFPALTTTVVDENATNSDFLIGNGIRDLFSSEIHLVLRTHGQEITDNNGLRDAQLSTFNGGCEDGEPNAGQCQNVQFAFFSPYY